jgi:LysM repeat protein
MRKSLGLAGALVLGGLLFALQAGAKPQVHVVQSGQRLGSIAKRYNVTVDELCEVNGISRRQPIKPGQKLVIPGPGAKEAKAKVEKEEAKAKADKEEATNKAQAKADKEPAKAKAVPAKSLSIHTVYAGQRLASIAKRYQVTLEALCFANDLSQYEPIKPGQKLVIPEKDDVDGRMARRARADLLGEPSAKLDPAEEATGKGGRKYFRVPKVRGYVTLIGYSQSWKGHIVRRGKVQTAALTRISELLGAEGSERVPPRLLELLSQVSDTFGGRPIRVVSGFREFSYVAESRHKTGHAIDFSIPGVPNSAVRDYLRTFKNVGVGYYPNSSFVHFDVRGHNSYWIDYAGPGQPPRLTPNGPFTKPIDQPEPTPPSEETIAPTTPEPNAATPTLEPSTASVEQQPTDSVASKR